MKTICEKKEKDKLNKIYLFTHQLISLNEVTLFNL